MTVAIDQPVPDFNFATRTLPKNANPLIIFFVAELHEM